jgi:hypothetical protein
VPGGGSDAESHAALLAELTKVKKELAEVRAASTQ